MQRPIVVKLSRERSVGLQVRAHVCLSSALWKNGGSFGIIGRTAPGMRQVLGFGNRSTGRRRPTFWGEFGARHCNQWRWRLYGVGVRQCLNRRSCGLGWCVRWAKALLYYMGVHIVQREGEVWGIVPHFHNGKCHWAADGEMYAKTLLRLLPQTYLEKLDLWAFWWYVPFQHPRRGL